jgi:hypothetical protein
VTDDQTASNDLEIDLRVVAASEVIDSLAAALDERDQEFSVAKVFDPSYLGLDLSTAADLATIVTATLISDPLIPTLAHWFGPKTKSRRIYVETPLGRVTLETREDLSPDEIRSRLARIVKLL